MCSNNSRHKDMTHVQSSAFCAILPFSHHSQCWKTGTTGLNSLNKLDKHAYIIMTNVNSFILYLVLQDK